LRRAWGGGSSWSTSIAEITGGCMMVTNAGAHCEAISRVVGAERCVAESVEELLRRRVLDPRRTLVLDPRAERVLEPGEAAEAEAIVVGGILGDHPPRGRTWSLLTRRLLRLGAEARSLGPEQMSIDGAVYTALQIAAGRRLEELEFIDSPSFEVETPDGFVWTVTLPFRYPAVDGKPLVSPKLLRLLRGGLGFEEARLARSP